MNSESAYAVIVVSFNSGPTLLDCVGHLVAEGLADRLIVVDNASADASPAEVRRHFPAVRLIANSRNLGFAGGANAGIRVANADAVVVLNPDVIIDREALGQMAVTMASDSRIGVVGGKLLYPDGKTIQHAGGRLSHPLALADHDGYGEEDRGQWDEEREVEYVTGAAIALKRTVLEEIGFFDEGFFPAYFEESDLCFRARAAGYKVVYTPRAVAIHRESATIERDSADYYHLYHRGRLRFVLKHYTDEQLWNEFRPAELARQRAVSRGELAALGEAYDDNHAVLEDRVVFAADPTAAAPLPRSGRRSPLLQELRSAARARLAEGDPAIAAVRERAAGLAARSQLVEPPFVSPTPLVGSLIARFRTLWNSVSTKWYLRPIMRQQSEINAEVAESIRTAADALAGLGITARSLEQTAADDERTAMRLNKELVLLEKRVRKLEEHLAAMQDRQDVRNRN